MARRYVEQHIASDPEFCHLEGPHLPDEEPEDWLRRRILRQWLWRGIIGSCVDDWGRFSPDPHVICGVLAIDLQPPPGWLTAGVEDALNHYERGLRWITRYRYGHPDYPRFAAVVWAWPRWHSLSFAGVPKHTAPPRDVVEEEATRRGLPPLESARGALNWERFVAIHTWNSSIKALRVHRADIFKTEKRWEPGK